MGGGAVANAGSMVLRRCSFQGNSAAPVTTPGEGTAKGQRALGGALLNLAGARLDAAHCTFSGNTGTGGRGAVGIAAPFPPSSARGGSGGTGCGGIYNMGRLSLVSCTLAGNKGTGGMGGAGSPDNPVSGEGPPGYFGTGVGGVDSPGGSCFLQNCIIAGNSGVNGSSGSTPSSTSSLSAPDVRGAVTSSGYNLIGGSTGNSGFTNATDVSGAAALLGPFQNNGGPVDTMVPLPNSHALDQGWSGGAASDQRGLARTYDDAAVPNASNGDGTDKGAVEFQPQTWQAPSLWLSLPASDQPAAKVARLCFRGEPSQKVQLQRAGGLNGLESGFDATGPVLTTDTAGRADFLDPTPFMDRGFYRVVTVLPR